MAERCTCGAYPPDDAKFCHKCGRPLYDYIPVEVQEEPHPEPPPLPAPAAVAPLHVGFRNGLAVRIGLLSALLTVLLNAVPLPPILALLRLPLLSCGAGWFAVWSWIRRTRHKVSIEEGARLGWIVGVLTFVMFAAVTVAAIPAILTELQHQAPTDPEKQQALQILQRHVGGAIAAILAALFVFFTALPTIAGAISARLLGRHPQ